jgi:ABC-type transport system substrate-binding protein
LARGVDNHDVKAAFQAVSSLLVGAAVVACNASPTPTPSTSAPPTASGGSIIIAFQVPPFAASPLVRISNAFGFRPPLRAEIVTQLVYNGIYRYDDSLSPVPDLASEPCQVAADMVTITCKLVETAFHNGTPLTADDAAFTYELARRDPNCLFGFGACVGSMLDSARAIDARTVEFRLKAPNATFLTLALPSVFIDSRQVVEAAYASLADHADDLAAADYRGAADDIATELDSADPDCNRPLPDADALFRSAGLDPLPRDQFNGADGQFDSCLYIEESRGLLAAIAASLDTTGLDAIALAYPALSFNRSPIGTGPWRFMGVENGSTAKFEAFSEYHLGPPATGHIEVRVLRDQAKLLADLRSGELDWVPMPPDVFEAVKGAPNLQFVTYPDSAYFMLAYNVRPGALFADHDLRAAVELCIDKPATVDAATDGTGVVIYSPIEPASWAYDPNLPRPERDVPQARRLIEGLGWVPGGDGIYEKDGKRLATDVFVRTDDTQRIAFTDLVGEQVKDCGIDLTTVQADGDAILEAVSNYPHVMPGDDEPYEAVMIGISSRYDPDDSTWQSSSISSLDQPDGPNFMGFSNDEVDALLDAGRATYDQRERARIYREFQDVLAREKPVLFGWAARLNEALDEHLSLTDRELNFSSRQWMWQLEKLVLK